MKKISPIHYNTPENIVAGFSTRQGGMSTGEHEGLNLGLNTTDNLAMVASNRRNFFETVANGFQPVYLTQIHSNIILNADADNFLNNSEADGIFSTMPNKLLCVSAADCGNVVFYSNEGDIVLALHAGWKGARDGILENACKILSNYCALKSVIAILGPCIHSSKYEVGKEFYNFFDAKFLQKKNDMLYLNLPLFISDTLKKNGIETILDYCEDTFSNPKNFYSYRRDGQTGRMIAYIGRKKN